MDDPDVEEGLVEPDDPAKEDDADADAEDDGEGKLL